MLTKKENSYCLNTTKNNTEKFIGIYRYYSTRDLGWSSTKWTTPH